jgi:hypothetical protein
MREKAALPPLNQVVSDWRERGEFFFLKKFLDDMRAAQRAPSATTTTLADANRGLALERVGALFRFLLQFVICAFAPKGRTIVFNHTNRFRQAEGARLPLYMSQVFDFSKMIVFEDRLLDLKYSKPTLRLDAMSINRCAEIIGAFVVRLYARKPSQAQRDIANFYVKRALWRSVLQLLKPRCVRLFVWYGKEAIVSAAKSLNLEVADVQHGIIYPSHPLYDLLQVRDLERSSMLLPDRALVYGEYWRELLVRAGWRSEQVDVVGYFLETSACKKAGPTGSYVLYTSQPHTNEAIIGHVESVLPAFRAAGLKVVIALHPLEGPEGYATLVTRGVEIANTDSYDAIRDCVVHISVSSTLLWEAMAFDRPSYVLDFGRDAPELLQDLLAFGFGRKLRNGDFPHPFDLPTDPPQDFFFQSAVDHLAFLEPKVS